MAAPTQPYAVRLVIQRAEAAEQTRKPEGSPEVEPRFEGRWVLWGGQTLDPFPLDLPLSKDDTEELRWYLEGYYRFVGAGTRKRAQKIAGKLPGWGRALFDALFGTIAARDVYHSMMAAVDDGRPVYLTLGSSEQDVLIQPWELLHDSRGPLALRGVSIRRQLEGEKIYQQLELPLPLRVLLIISRPTDSGFIDPRTSLRPLIDALDHLPAGSVQLEFCQPPTFSELEERIAAARKQKRPFHIVHFDGHGTYLPETGVGALCFETETNKTDLVTGRRLGGLMARLDVPLVMLEACRTADLSDKPIFGSVAPALLQSGVGSVVAFSHAVHVEAARLLVERFYRELAQGLSVGSALAEARAKLFAQPKRWLALGPEPPTVELRDWFIPQLYQVGPDLSLVRGEAEWGDTEPEPRPSIRERLHEFPPRPQYGFQGRARELLELERAFEKHEAVVLAGGGGMGKTSLAREAAAWWLRTGRFDEAVFCSFEQVRSVEQAVQILGHALEGLEFAQRPAAEQASAAARLFRERRVLLVWDNYESTLTEFQDRSEGALAFEAEERRGLRAFFRALTEAETPRDRPVGRLLVTCRPVSTGLPGIRQIELSGLSRPDSLHLLSAIADQRSIDMERMGYEAEKIERLLDDLQDHPLSISLVGPHLKDLKPDTIRQDFGTLLDRFTDEGALEGRNRSLEASLAFSVRRLGKEARKVLPWLAWFEGGAFEAQIRNFTGLEPEVWARIRGELQATALVRVEELQGIGNPFIRFHPTLIYAASSKHVPNAEEAEQRFVAAYLAVSREVGAALNGRTPAAGMVLMTREEANVRSAIDRAFGRGERQVGWHIADALRIFLQMSARRGERDRLATWVREQMTEADALDAATCDSLRRHAEGLFERGELGQAVELLQNLAARLESEGLADGEDRAFQLGTTYVFLAQILDNARHTEPAIAASRWAIRVLEALSGDAARGNLSAALGVLANALNDLGHYDEALEAAERGVKIDEALGLHRNIATDHGRCAQILAAQGRYAEADGRYAQALELARGVGDLELEGSLLQHQGSLSRKQGNLGRSVEHFEAAVRAFRQAQNRSAAMRTYELLGTSETDRGHFDAAEAWYARSRALAVELEDRTMLGANAQNMGILWKSRAEQAANERERRRLLGRAVASVEESLAIWLELGDQLQAAGSYFQSGWLYRLLGDLEAAEPRIEASLAIYEPLKHPELWKVYDELAEVAEARGDSESAIEWAAKRDAKSAELRRLAAGPEGGPSRLPEQVAQAFLSLAQGVHAVRSAGQALPPDLAEVLAYLGGQGGPLAAAGSFLDRVVSGESPPIPPGLPEPLPEMFEGLLASLE